MSRLPCPEEHEMAGFPEQRPEAAFRSTRTAAEEMSSIEGLLMYYGRFVNEMSTRGPSTPVEKAFLEAGQRFFQELADSCAKMAEADRSDPTIIPRDAGFESTEFLNMGNEDDFMLESAGGSSVAEQKAVEKRAAKEKPAKRKARSGKGKKR